MTVYGDYPWCPFGFNAYDMNDSHDSWHSSNLIFHYSDITRISKLTIKNWNTTTREITVWKLETTVELEADGKNFIFLVNLIKWFWFWVTSAKNKMNAELCFRGFKYRPEQQREIKFIGLFGDRGHRGPYSPYKPCNHNLYIKIIIFPHIDYPQSTGYN